MISTAIALQDATKNAVHDPMIVEIASDLFQSRYISDEEFMEKLYGYSAMLASMTTTLVVNTLLTESQMDEMITTIREMESMGKDLDNGNND